MRSAFDDQAFVENKNFVGMDDRRKPMRDDQRRAAFRHALERRLDFALGETIERRCRFVQHEDRRSFQDGARNRDALLFAARQFQSALADLRAIALRQGTNETVDLRVDGGLRHVFIGRAVAPIANIVEDAVVEQNRVLRNHADRLAQRGLRDAARYPVRQS